MPSGGQTAVTEEEAAVFVAVMTDAFKNRLELEWATFFLGGLKARGITSQQASLEACRAAVEWDF